MELTKEDATWAADKLINYFNNFGRIDDYFRTRKLERIRNLPVSLPGMGVEKDMFTSFDMNPEEMNFDVVLQTDSMFDYDTMLEKTASFSPDQNPGKQVKILVIETNTNTVVGFIRLGSPLINSKPRNDYLGGVPDLPIFNKRAIMGFNIVPIQPFGYNYLGGKLLAAICCSHKIRRLINEKYNNEFCLFETTSLYGNIKGASMYDGMKPFLRYKGDTVSSFLLTLGEEIYVELKEWFTRKNDGEELIHKSASSRKLKMQSKMVGTVKSSLKDVDTVKYNEFSEAMKKATDVTTQKRFYMSEYGYSNAKDVLLGKTEVLEKAENYDRFELENVIKWCKKYATKRYKKMVTEKK